MENMTIREFVLALSSKEPTPGGGPAGAAAGAFACSLGMMVCNISIGKKKLEAYDASNAVIRTALERLRENFLHCMDKDAECFLPLSAAYSMPKSTPEEKEKREVVMEKALNMACEVPMELVMRSMEVIELLTQLSDQCSKLVLSDIQTAAALLKACGHSGLINVKANTVLMQDKENAEKLEGYAQETFSLLEQCCDALQKKLS